MTMRKPSATNDSLERFAFEFTRFPEILPENEGKFLKWVYPLNQKSFSHKVVLDAGCGNGRNSLWVLKYGAQEVVAFDNHPATVSVARRNLEKFRNAKVLLQSIYDLPFRNKFDVVMCIGVLQHLENPQLAVKNLVRACNKGGTVVAWAYGYKGNEFIVRFINPLRSITSRLPLFLPYALAFGISLLLYSYLRLFRPQKGYFKLMSTYSFRLLFNIVFDHLIPKIANYWTKNEVSQLFRQAKLTKVKVFSVAGNTWTVLGIKI